MEFGTKTVSRTYRKIWERKFAGAAAIGPPKREGLYFLPQKGDGHGRPVAKEARQGATLSGIHEVGVEQKEQDGSGLSQMGTEKTLPKQKDAQLRGKAIERGFGKMGSNVGICGVIDQKKGEPLFFFFNRHTGFRCQHRPLRLPLKIGICGKERCHRWAKKPPRRVPILNISLLLHLRFAFGAC